MIVLRSRVSRVDAVAFSPDGSQLAIGGTNGVELWSVHEHAQIWRWQDPSDLRSIQRLYFGSNGVLIACSVYGYPFLLFDAVSGQHTELRYPYSDDRPLRSSWDAVEERLITDNSFRISCWRFERDGPRKKQAFPLSRVVVWDTPFQFSCQGHFVRRPVGQPNQSPALWLLGQNDWQTRNPDTGEVLRGYRGACTRTEELIDAPEVNLIVGRSQASLLLWKYNDLKNPLRLRKETNNQFTGMALHPSGIFLATTSNDRVVRIWDLRRWIDCKPWSLNQPQQAVRTYEWRTGRMRSIAFSPDGLFAAAGGELGEFVLFDTEL